MIICLVIRIVESPNTTNEQANIDGQETTEKHLIRMSTVYFCTHLYTNIGNAKSNQQPNALYTVYIYTKHTSITNQFIKTNSFWCLPLNFQSGNRSPSHSPCANYSKKITKLEKCQEKSRNSPQKRIIKLPSYLLRVV